MTEDKFCSGCRRTLPLSAFDFWPRHIAPNNRIKARCRECIGSFCGWNLVFTSNVCKPRDDAAVRAGFVLIAQCEALEAGIYGLVGMPLTEEEMRRGR